MATGLVSRVFLLSLSSHRILIVITFLFVLALSLFGSPPLALPLNRTLVARLGPGDDPAAVLGRPLCLVYLSYRLCVCVCVWRGRSLSLRAGGAGRRRGASLRQRVHRVLAVLLDPRGLEQVDLEVRLPLLLHGGVVLLVVGRQHEARLVGGGVHVCLRC